MSCISGAQYITLVYWSFYVSAIMFVAVVVQISIMQTYLLVCYEEHRWWWRCWALGASTGFFMIMFFINYFILKLKVAHLTTLIVYTVFAGVISLSLSLMTGALALFASFAFNRAIFKKVSID